MPAGHGADEALELAGSEVDGRVASADERRRLSGQGVPRVEQGQPAIQVEGGARVDDLGLELVGDVGDRARVVLGRVALDERRRKASAPRLPWRRRASRSTKRAPQVSSREGDEGAFSVGHQPAGRSASASLPGLLAACLELGGDVGHDDEQRRDGLASKSGKTVNVGWRPSPCRSVWELVQRASTGRRPSSTCPVAEVSGARRRRGPRAGRWRRREVAPDGSRPPVKTADRSVLSTPPGPRSPGPGRRCRGRGAGRRCATRAGRCGRRRGARRTPGPATRRALQATEPRVRRMVLHPAPPPCRRRRSRCVRAGSARPRAVRGWRALHRRSGDDVDGHRVLGGRPDTRRASRRRPCRHGPVQALRAPRSTRSSRRPGGRPAPRSSS